MVNEKWAYPSYHSVAHDVGRGDGKARYLPKEKTQNSRTVWYYTVTDEDGNLWDHGKSSEISKRMGVSPQRISGAAMYGFTMLGRFTVTREQLRNEDLS